MKKLQLIFFNILIATLVFQAQAGQGHSHTGFVEISLDSDDEHSNTNTFSKPIQSAKTAISNMGATISNMGATITNLWSTITTPSSSQPSTHSSGPATPSPATSPRPIPTFSDHANHPISPAPVTGRSSTPTSTSSPMLGTATKTTPTPVSTSGAKGTSAARPPVVTSADPGAINKALDTLILQLHAQVARKAGTQTKTKTTELTDDEKKAVFTHICTIMLDSTNKAPFELSCSACADWSQFKTAWAMVEQLMNPTDANIKQGIAEMKNIAASNSTELGPLFDRLQKNDAFLDFLPSPLKEMIDFRGKWVTQRFTFYLTHQQEIATLSHRINTKISTPADQVPVIPVVSTSSLVTNTITQSPGTAAGIFVASAAFVWLVYRAFWKKKDKKSDKKNWPTLSSLFSGK